MKPLFCVILGVASLIVPIPQNLRDGVSVGGVSLGIEIRHNKLAQSPAGAGFVRTWND
jgi:hypothetical protein